LHPFMHQAEAMRDAITHLPDPNPMAQLNRNFSSLMQWTITELFKYWGPAYPIQLSEDLFQVHRQFTPNSVILPLNTDQATGSSLVDVVANGIRAVLRHSLVAPIPPNMEKLTPESAATRVSVRFGHLGSDAYLVPALRLDSKIS
uniref:Type VI secretion system baseplate subunit TssF n=1 Tax=Echinostoma caproni TaxID=27848 RepID=A0A183BDI6_9TREM